MRMSLVVSQGHHIKTQERREGEQVKLSQREKEADQKAVGEAKRGEF